MRKEYRLTLACFCFAFCSLSYEFLLAQMMAVLGGHTVFFYCLTIGLYIFALGIGSLMAVERCTTSDVMRRLYGIEVGLLLLGGGAPFWMIGGDFLVRPLHGAVAAYAPILAHAALVLAIGFLSGMEVPLLLRLAEIRNVKSLVTRLLAIDYAASFIGALAFPLWLFPQLGVVMAAAVLCLVNIAGMLLIVPLATKGWRLWVTAASFALTVLILVNEPALVSWLSAAFYL